MNKKANLTENKSAQYDETEGDLAQSVPDAEIPSAQPSGNEDGSDNDNDGGDNTRDAMSIDQLEAIARKISRTTPDGLSYAKDIAARYGLHLEGILENVK